MADAHKKVLIQKQSGHLSDLIGQTGNRAVVCMTARFFKQQEQKYAEELSAALEEYKELQSQAADLDSDELAMARLAIRPEKEASAESRLQAAYGKKYDLWTIIGAKQDVAEMLGEEEPRSIRERLQERERQKQRDEQLQHRKSKERGGGR